MRLRLLPLSLACLFLSLAACASLSPEVLPTRAVLAPSPVAVSPVAVGGAPPGAAGVLVAVPTVPTPPVTPRVGDAAATATSAPTSSPPTATATMTATPPPTAVPSPTPTPDPLGVTLDALRARQYPGGPVEILRTLETTDTYTRYYIAYPSDGLRITGIMQIPPGPGPFPVIILNHGYHDRGSYWAGSGTWMAAEYLNGRGYLTIAPDYRTWGESDWGPSLFHTGLVADVLNLIGSLPSIPQADPARLGMWGHSMGGGITTKVLTIDSRVRAAVLYAANSGDDADLIARWGRGCLPGESQATTNCNPGEAILADLPPEVIADYVAAAADPARLRDIAPIYHLDRVTAPVQIHIGAADGAELNATPPEWSIKLYAAFQAAGKPAELFVYEGQGHLFYGQGWSEMITRVGDFFDLYVK